MHTALSAMRPSMPGIVPSVSMPAASLWMAPGQLIRPLGARVPLVAEIPKGVDLNLSQFSLDAPQQVKEGRLLSEPQSKDGYRAVTDAFWSCMDEGMESILQQDDLKLLKNIFNPH